MGQDVTFDIIARDRASKTFDKVGGAAKKGLKAMTAGLAVAGAAAVKFGVDSVKSASLAEQSLGGTEAVFGKYAKTVIKQSNAAAKAYGLSANEFRESSNLIGALLKNQGLPMDQLAGKTKTLVGLSSDLAATYGGTTKDAVEALSSALKGEFDPLEQFGVSLKQSTINTEAYRVANVDSKKAFDALSVSQQKAATRQATMNLLMKQSKDAQGQFAKQSDTLAERQQILAARFENVKAKIGAKLLPVVSKLVGFIDDRGIPALEDFGEAAEKYVGRFVKDFKAGEGAAGDIRDALEAVVKIGKVVWSFFNSIPGPVKKFAVQGLIAYGVLRKLQSGFAVVGSSGTASFVRGLMNAETRMATVTKKSQQLGAGLRNVAGAGGMIALTDASNRSSKALGTLEGAAGGAALGFAIGGPLGAGVGALGGGLLGLFSSGKKASKGLMTAADAALAAIGPFSDYQDTLDGVAASASNATREMAYNRLQSSGLLDATRKLGIADRTAVNAIMGKVGAQEKLGNALRAEETFHKKGLSKKVIDALWDEGVAIRNARQAQLEKNVATAEGKRAVDKAREALEKFGRTKATGTIKLAGADRAMQQLRDLQNLLARVLKPGKGPGKKVQQGGDLSGLLGVDVLNGRGRSLANRFQSPLQQWTTKFVASIAKGMPKAKVAIERVKSALSSLQDRMSSLRDTRAEFASTFSSDSIFGADIETTGSLSGLLQFSQKQAQSAQRLLADIQAVTSKGLSKGLIEQLRAQGSSGAAQLHLLAGASAAQIAQFNDLDKATSAANTAAGLAAGNYVRGGNIDADIAAAKMQQAVAQAVARELGKLKLEAKVKGGDLIVAVRNANHNRGRAAGDFSR